MIVFWDGFEKDLRDFENYLKQYFDEHFENGEFKKIVSYSLIDTGGKRIRPLLLIKTALSLGAEFQTAYKFGVAIECIHTYSLIHDDLPSMDNDTYRRGFLSAHAKYSEALAILSGDSLLNFAYEVIFDNDFYDDKVKKAADIMSRFAGSKGMIKGQVLDMGLTNTSDIDNQKQIYQIHINKTAALIRAAVNAGALLGNAEQSELKKLDDYACNMGICFQILDDISDFETEQDKLTYPKVFGLENSLNHAQKYKQQAYDALKGIEKKYFHLYQLLSKLSPNIF